MPEPYSNRELDQMFKALDEKQEERHEVMTQRMDVFESNTSTGLMRIEEQTKKTNGSVASLKLWRAYMTGALAVIGALLFSVILPLVSAYISR